MPVHMCDCSNPSLASGKSERREPSVGDWAAGESLEADLEGNLVAALTGWLFLEAWLSGAIQLEVSVYRAQ